MLQIEDTIVSLALIEKKFSCDLETCKGSCCRYGDSGAPLTGDESAILKSILPELRPYLRKEGLAAIELKGTSMTDMEGDIVTPLINNEECAYTVLEDGVFRCAIEIAFNAGAVSIRKPLSCHLFPVRIRQYRDFRAVNYEEWPICRPAVANGERQKLGLWVYLRTPLVRAFGEEWYNQLRFAAEEYDKNTKIWK
jgi:hypothetical protein